MNYVEWGRSNYFTVRDVQVFTTWAHELGLEVITRTDEQAGVQLVGFLVDTEQGIPNSRWDENLGEEISIDFAIELSQHLAPDHVAIVMAVGYEGMRYVTGYAFAVNAAGEVKSRHLHHIYEDAKTLGGHIAHAAY